MRARYRSPAIDVSVATWNRRCNPKRKRVVGAAFRGLLAAASVLALARALAMPAAAQTPSPVTSSGTVATLAIATVAAPPPLDPRADPAAWNAIPAVSLAWDVQHQRRATEPAQARLATDGRFFYARFDVKQRERLLQIQHANNVGDGTDDEVWVDFWPGGNAGFYYQFAATSNGTHFQYSSENSVYEPTWESHGSAFDGGFTVTMKIPIDILRGTGNGSTWKVQFVRIVRSTGERQIWSYAPAQTNGDDVTFAGLMAGMAPVSGARPKPRVALYGLGEAGSAASGLSTSRAGADFSLPVTPTASFFGTVHPDFSNVEVDQATISPTAFARFFSEVRPFFTQTSNYFDNFDCDACPGLANIYTPNIPTPRQGYAIEGHQGQIAFAAFDSVGFGRIDAAESLGYKSPDNHVRYFMENVSANCSLPATGACPFGRASVHDTTFANGLSYNDGKHVSGYANYGTDGGSNVAAGDQAQHYDLGTYLYTNTSGLALSTRKIGRYFVPADGLVQHPDIAGYAAYAVKLWNFTGASKLNSAGVSFYADRYHNRFGPLDQTDNGITFDALTKNRIDVTASIGSSYLLQDFDCTAATCVFSPVSQNGLGITYHSGTVSAPGNFPSHGGSSTPTSLTFNTGRFGPGRLDSWTRSTTMVAGTRGTLSLEADDTRQYLDARGRTNVQWLERASYTYAPSADSSFAIGVRRIVGTPPVVFAAAPTSCTTVATIVQIDGSLPCTGAWNLSFAFHRRAPHDELYVGYGDASRLSTTPAFVLKLIHYFGAEKGT